MKLEAIYYIEHYFIVLISLIYLITFFNSNLYLIFSKFSFNAKIHMTLPSIFAFLYRNRLYLQKPFILFKYSPVFQTLSTVYISVSPFSFAASSSFGSLQEYGLWFKEKNLNFSQYYIWSSNQNLK